MFCQKVGAYQTDVMPQRIVMLQISLTPGKVRIVSLIASNHADIYEKKRGILHARLFFHMTLFFRKSVNFVRQQVTLQICA